MIDIIQPDIFQTDRAIKSAVTLKGETRLKGKQNIPGLNLGFNTQESADIVERNRQTMIDELGLDNNWIAFARQVHSNRIRVITGGGIYPNTDGLITQVPGLALAIQIADCAAVLIADLASQTIAAVHAGWRGAASDIVPRAMKKMGEIGAKMNRCKAFVSPCICVEHFEVGQEVASQFPAFFVECDGYEKPHVDLKGFLWHQLRQGGINESNIEIHPGCTMGDERYYSYRREQERSGRMMAVIQIATE